MHSCRCPFLEDREREEGHGQWREGGRGERER